MFQTQASCIISIHISKSISGQTSKCLVYLKSCCSVFLRFLSHVLFQDIFVPSPQTTVRNTEHKSVNLILWAPLEVLSLATTVLRWWGLKYTLLSCKDLSKDICHRECSKQRTIITAVISPSLHCLMAVWSLTNPSWDLQVYKERR